MIIYIYNSKLCNIYKYFENCVNYMLIYVNLL